MAPNRDNLKEHQKEAVSVRDDRNAALKLSVVALCTAFHRFTTSIFCTDDSVWRFDDNRCEQLCYAVHCSTKNKGYVLCLPSNVSAGAARTPAMDHRMIIHEVTDPSFVSYHRDWLHWLDGTD
jgi:hypothetical protein